MIVEAEDRDNIFGISYDKVAYLTKRITQTSFQTFLPEIISIPNVALHPFANNKDITTLQIDLACFEFQHRLPVLLLFRSQFPRWWTTIQSHLLDRLNLKQFPTANGAAQQFSAQAYSNSGQFLSIPMFDTFNISKMIVTRKTKGEEDVSIIQSPKAEDNSYILIIRALDVIQKN